MNMKRNQSPDERNASINSHDKKRGSSHRCRDGGYYRNGSPARDGQYLHPSKSLVQGDRHYRSSRRPSRNKRYHYRSKSQVQSGRDLNRSKSQVQSGRDLNRSRSPLQDHISGRDLDRSRSPLQNHISGRDLNRSRSPLQDHISGRDLDRSRSPLQDHISGSPVRIYLDDFFEMSSVGECDMGNVKSLRKIRSEESDKSSRIKEMTEGAQKQPNNSSAKLEQEKQPPDNFREIAICPNAADLANENPFLRVNLVKGNYKDLQTYLDTQFRLLREDLVKPLRDGIQEFKNRKTKGRFGSQGVQIYTKVKILAPDCTPQGITHQVRFSLNGLEHAGWENSKRLIFGSLLCFSPDEFQTVIFGTVANRDPDHLKNGRIDVLFLDDDLDLTLTFVMVESPSYFEAYRYVLKALQKVTEEVLPFQRYLIGNQQTNVLENDSDEDNAIKIVQDPPRYLDVGSKYDITPLMKKEYKQHGKDIAVLDSQRWPAEEMLNLDSSQLAAVKSAVTKELSIIQGPPGTGKTYVALKVAEVLLLNSETWDESGPILVLCFTNHALDQFLEGILDFHQRPQDIVRVGSQSNNKRLANCNLKSLRTISRKERRSPSDLRRSFFDIRQEQDAAELSIDKASIKMEATKTEILSERELNLSNEVLESLEEGYFTSNEHPDGILNHPKCLIAEWLECGNVKIKGQYFNNRTADVENNNKVAAEENIEVAGEAKIAFDKRVDEEGQELMDHLKQARERKRKIREDMNIGLDLESDHHYDHKDQERQISREEEKRKEFALKQLRRTSSMNDHEKECAERNLWQLTLEDRWKLYRTWILDFCLRLQDEIGRQREVFNEKARRLEEVRELESIHIMKQSKVIGMTTTGAAKNHSLVQKLSPSIVIVEEAAEVLEAHVIAGLTPSVQHLILIGDHQQLRPSPAVYELSQLYNFDVSLFERLIKNNLSFDRLDIQHRMHPDISKLLVPHIYKDLHDHESVSEYPRIKGVSSNMFFVNHRIRENYIQDSMSKQNDHEAAYMVELCRYLIKQGYEKEKIAILTTYSGQLFAFREKMKKEEFLGVRVSTVDNYQGEESQIILLSLVRSNREGSIGFLGIDNRVCVALSRAKHALYCIGNFDQLCEKSKLWTNIIKYVRQVNSVGRALTLACQRHPEYSKEVSDPSDFIKMFPEGGCTKPCKFSLSCGHTCQRTCHSGSHENYKCRKGCSRGKRDTCPLDHRCKKLCYQDCGPCPDPVEKTIGRCGHKQTMRCGDDPELTRCRKPCVRTRMCGHKCERSCGDDCNRDACRIKPTIELKCGHQKIVACATKDADHNCSRKCDQVLDCQHKCTGTCDQCKQGRLHVGCAEKCGRPLACGQGEDIGQVNKVKLRVLDERDPFMENYEEIETAVNTAVSIHQLLVVEQQVKMLNILDDCTENVKEISSLNPNLKSGKVFMILLKEATHMKNHLTGNLENKNGMTQQQLREASNEVTRIQYLKQFFSALRDREETNLTFTKKEIQIMESTKEVLLDDVKPFSEKKAAQVKEMLKELEEKDKANIL